MSDNPVFETRQVGGRPLIVCTYMGETGAARVFSDGEAEARQRAENQVRDKVAAKQQP